jgi:hypothetical protein
LILIVLNITSDLHNRFSPLAQTEDQDQLDQQEKELPFIPLAKPFTIYPDDIDLSFGHRRFGRSLEKN